MKFFLLSLFYYLFEFIKSIKIYQCGRYNRMASNQCLNQWVDVYGNIKVDLWKCKSNRYCHLLPKRNDEENFIGVCAFNYKKLYDQDSCNMNSECSTIDCQDSKCVGFPIGEYCRPNIFQCANNLVCRSKTEILPYGETKQVYKCDKLSKVNETCDNNNECDIRLICANSSIYQIYDLMKKNNINNIKELTNVIDFENYILLKQNDTKICIERAILDNGFPTSDSMVCKSGDSINLEIYHNYTESVCVSKKEIINDCGEDIKCIITVNLSNINDTVSQDCIISVRGNPFCPLNEKELAWKEYLKKYDEFYKSENVEGRRESEFHFPVYKDTFNNLLISQYFWQYKEWYHTVEADSCVKQFFFLLNNEKTLNSYFSYFIITLILFL